MVDEDELRIKAMDARERIYSSLGDLHPNLLVDVRPPWMTGFPLWPGGSYKFRILQREGKFAILTDGLSDPFSETYHPEIHSSIGLGVEFMIETDQKNTIDLAAVPDSWLYRLIFFVSMFTMDNFAKVLGTYHKFQMITLFCTPDSESTELNPFVAPNGLIGLLAGQTVADLPPVMELPEGPVNLILLKLMTPDEYDYAVSLGNDGGLMLASMYQKNGKGHLSALDRQSVLKM